MTKPSHAQNTYFHRDPFTNRRGDVRLSSRGAYSPHWIRSKRAEPSREARREWIDERTFVNGKECISGKARGGGGLGKITELTPPNGRGGLVCRVLSAEPVLRRPIYQTLFKRGVGAALVAAQRRSLQTPRRILSLRGTRT
jgi:hypothetical protein